MVEEYLVTLGHYSESERKNNNRILELNCVCIKVHFKLLGTIQSKIGESSKLWKDKKMHSALNNYPPQASEASEGRN